MMEGGTLFQRFRHWLSAASLSQTRDASDRTGQEVLRECAEWRKVFAVLESGRANPAACRQGTSRPAT